MIGEAVRKKKIFLKGRFVEFQLKIHELNRRRQEQEEAFLAREQEMLQELFRVLDTIDDLEEIICAEEAANKPPRWARLVRLVQTKLLRLLESRSAVPLEFPDGKALMEYCKILETRTDETLADETIVSIVKKGYLDKQRCRVLRKAEVITVRNLRPKR